MASSLPSAAVAVDKATSALLLGPDWTMNIDICDSINSSHWQAKDVVRALKRRLQHKQPRVQVLALTLLESMVKNCGDYVHSQIAEKNILGDMVKAVKKKVEMPVRDKILALLDSWQESFGGRKGKYPQYYWAYDELRRSGVVFPRRSSESPKSFSQCASLSNSRFAQSGSSRRLDETMATEIESLSLSSLESMRDVTGLLNDMLQQVNPNDSLAVKQEVIVDLVNQCRSNQKKLMQMLTTTGDENLLASGLELNDTLQSLLAKHDAIAYRSFKPTRTTSITNRNKVPTINPKPTEVVHSSPRSSSTNIESPVATKSQIDDEGEDAEEDDFAQLARRHSLKQPLGSQNKSAENNQDSVAAEIGEIINMQTSDPVACNAIVPSDPPPLVKTSSKEQDMIDLLSLTLTTISINPEPKSDSYVSPDSTSTQSTHPQASESYSWAPQQQQIQPQFYHHHQTQQLPQTRSPAYNQYSQPQYIPQPQHQVPSQFMPQYYQYTSAYPPPPWMTTAGNSHTQQTNANPFYSTTQIPPSLQHSINGGKLAEQKPYIPSYRLFEDLNVFSNAGGSHKVTGSSSTSTGHSMLGGRKN